MERRLQATASIPPGNHVAIATGQRQSQLSECLYRCRVLSETIIQLALIAPFDYADSAGPGHRFVGSVCQRRGRTGLLGGSIFTIPNYRADCGAERAC